VDEIGLNTAAIHALWTLEGLGALGSDTKATEVAIAALKHPSAGVRRAAVMVLPRNEASLSALLNSSLLDDSDAPVRLAALLVLSEMPPNRAAGSAAFAALQSPRNAQDRWIPDAVTAAGARHDAGFVQAVLTSNPSSEADRVVRLVTAHYAQRGPADTIISTLSALKGASAEVATTVLEGLISGWPQDKPLALSAADKQTLTALMEALPEIARDRLLALAQRWGHPELFGTSVPAIIASLKEQIADAERKDAERAAAAKRLVGLADKPEVWKLVLDQVTLLTPPDLAIGLVNALGDSRDGAPGQATGNRDQRNRNRTSPTAGAIIERWAQFTPTVRRAAIALLMRRAEWAGALLQAVEDRTISKTDLAPEHWSQLKQNPNQFIARRAERLAERSGNVATGREEIVLKLLPLAKEMGDPVRGKEVFTANCSVCHHFNGEGKHVGPELTGIAARDRSDILMEILDPNRSVEANYRAWTVNTKDGETYTGRLESETQTTVEILDTTAQKHVIQRQDIASLNVSSNSIMPTGFESLPPDDLKALLEYLATPSERAGSQ
jgi:putative heme-binding domain-containing protein